MAPTAIMIIQRRISLGLPTSVSADGGLVKGDLNADISFIDQGKNYLIENMISTVPVDNVSERV